MMLEQTLARYFSHYRGVPLRCWWSISLTLLQAIAIGVCYFLSVYLVSELHFTVASAGFFLSSYGLGTVLGGFVSGYLVDRYGSYYLSIIALLVQALSFLLLAMLTRQLPLMINLFVLGVSTYGFKTANDVWMLQQCVANKALRLQVINLSRVALNMGLGLSGVIIGVFAEKHFVTIFISFAAMILSTAIVFASLRLHQVTYVTQGHPDNTQAVQPALHNRLIYVLMLVCLFCVGIMIAQLASTYPIYVKAAFPELGMRGVSFLFVLDTFIIVLVQAQLTEWLNARNSVRMLGLGVCLMGFGMLILSFAKVFMLAIVSCFIWTLGEMIFIPMAQLISYESGLDHQKGRALGWYQTVYACSAVVGPMFGGFVYQTVGGDALWYLFALCGAVCYLVCVYVSSLPIRYADAAMR